MDCSGDTVAVVLRNSKQVCPKRDQMRKTLIIFLLLTSALHADKTPKTNVTVVDTAPSSVIVYKSFKKEAFGLVQIDKNGVGTLTKKGQRANYNVVGASKKGTLLLSMNTKVNEGAFKVQLAKGAKVNYVEPDKDQDGSAKTDIGGHLLVEHSGVKTDMGGHLMVEATEIKTIFVEFWPPPITQNDNEADLLIVKAFGLLVSYGKIKLKKPPLTAGERAEHLRRHPF